MASIWDDARVLMNEADPDNNLEIGVLKQTTEDIEKAFRGLSSRIEKMSEAISGMDDEIDVIVTALENINVETMEHDDIEREIRYAIELLEDIQKALF
jgi:phosphate uptake regulator